MISLAICEDNRIHSAQLLELLEDFQKEEGLVFSLDAFENPQRLLQHHSNSPYQILLLDMELPGLSGLELAQAIRQQDSKVLILFLTSHDESMPQVFQVETFDFLVKPVSKDRLFPSLRRACQRILREQDYLTFSNRKQHIALASKEIFYIEKEGRMAHLHTQQETYSLRQSTKQLKGALPDEFIQIHHSYLINVRYYFKLEGNQLFLRLPQGQEIALPVSRQYKKGLQGQILDKLRSFYVLD